MDCVRAPDVCRISGGDTGIPNSRLIYGGSLGVSYPIFGKKGAYQPAMDWVRDMVQPSLKMMNTQLKLLNVALSSVVFHKASA